MFIEKNSQTFLNVILIYAPTHSPFCSWFDLALSYHLSTYVTLIASLKPNIYVTVGNNYHIKTVYATALAVKREKRFKTH